jgi:ABC-type multidrug transport system ATPase subunit
MELQVRSLRKIYGGGKVALDGIDVVFKPGVIGLVGPNGSGKTTLLRILATTLAPTGGEISWNGVNVARNPDALRRDLLYVPQNFVGYPNLSAQEFLSYLARIRGVESRAARRAADEALGAVGLGEDRKRRLGGFTPGMMQRLSIAYMLQTDAKVVLLDEPTAGLDPGARRLFSEAVRRSAQDSITILCTHIFDDLETLADRILGLRAGRVAEDAARNELQRVYADIFELEAAS